MNLIRSSVNSLHETGGHPENEGRLINFSDCEPFNGPEDETTVALVHTRQYISRIREICTGGGGRLDGDTVASAGSFRAAVAAVSAANFAADHGYFALVRPPGHHAHPERSGGFCIFNNMAIASERLVRTGKRVFILDIDGHLGDGTEKFFYNRKDVFYASLHQEHSFPGGGGFLDIGYGEGAGYTLNLPVPNRAGDDIFLKGIRHILEYADRFRPDYAGVSAGFDGHGGDPLLALNYSATAFHTCGSLLKGRYPNIFAVLEGGYNPGDLNSCVRNFVAGVNGYGMPYPEPPTETVLIELENFDEMLSVQKEALGKYWEI